MVFFFFLPDSLSWLRSVDTAFRSLWAFAVFFSSHIGRLFHPQPHCRHNVHGFLSPSPMSPNPPPPPQRPTAPSVGNLCAATSLPQFGFASIASGLHEAHAKSLPSPMQAGYSHTSIDSIRSSRCHSRFTSSFEKVPSFTAMAAFSPPFFFFLRLRHP